MLDPEERGDLCVTQPVRVRWGPCAGPCVPAGALPARRGVNPGLQARAASSQEKINPEFKLFPIKSCLATPHLASPACSMSDFLFSASNPVLTRLKEGSEVCTPSPSKRSAWRLYSKLLDSGWTNNWGKQVNTVFSIISVKFFLSFHISSAL